MSIREDVRYMKQTAPALAASSNEARNKALALMAEGLLAEK